MQDVQDHIDGMTAELSKNLKKDLQDSGLLCQAQFSELCNQLASRKAEITAKTEAYQKVLPCQVLSLCHAVPETPELGLRG